MSLTNTTIRNVKSAKKPLKLFIARRHYFNVSFLIAAVGQGWESIRNNF